MQTHWRTVHQETRAMSARADSCSTSATSTSCSGASTPRHAACSATSTPVTRPLSAVLGHFNALGASPRTPKRRSGKRRRTGETTEVEVDLQGGSVTVSVTPRPFYLRFSPFAHSRCIIPSISTASAADAAAFPQPQTVLQLYTLFCKMLHYDHVEPLAALLRVYPDAALWFLTPALAVGLDIERAVPDAVFRARTTRDLLQRVNLGAWQAGVLLRHAIDHERFELLRALHASGAVPLHSVIFDRAMAELEFGAGRDFPRRVYAVQQFVRSLADVRVSAPQPPPPLPLVP